MKVVIAAAGTAGHINPGIAIANKIKKEEPDSKIIFIGTTRGLENDLVPRAGYELKTINAYGITRELKIKNIKRFLATMKSKKEAKIILEEFKPDIVIGMGGYICMPTISVANRLGIPTILHESNAFLGIATKLLSKSVKSVLIGFEEARARLKNAKRVVLTGNPIKIDKIKVDLSIIRKEYNMINPYPIILVFGGSQGAKKINDVLIDIISKKLNEKYNIIWATGASAYDNVKEEINSNGLNINNIDKVKVLPYIYNMEELMNACDMLVCRSGSMTIAEIAKIGKPAIFIPFPFATENHQEYNAKVLEEKGAAKIILDKELTSEKLNDLINDIIKDENKLIEMSKNARKGLYT